MSLSSEVRSQLRREILVWMRGKGQGVAAEGLGVHQATLSAWVSGRRAWSIEKLLEVWERIGGQAKMLLGREEEEEVQE